MKRLLIQVLAQSTDHVSITKELANTTGIKSLGTYSQQNDGGGYESNRHNNSLISGDAINISTKKTTLDGGNVMGGDVSVETED